MSERELASSVRFQTPNTRARSLTGGQPPSRRQNERARTRSQTSPARAPAHDASPSAPARFGRTGWGDRPRTPTHGGEHA